ncbi:MAG TPA: hypothetical protein VI589_05940 [Vicinamibacteria bacterium]
MKIVYAACALLLLAVFAAPPAEAKGKTPKKFYDTNWGRRSDLTQKFWPVHQHPFVRF